MSILLVVLFVIFEVRGRPAIDITQPEHEVKVEGGAKLHLTLAFTSPIEVCCHLFDNSV